MTFPCSRCRGCLLEQGGSCSTMRPAGELGEAAAVSESLEHLPSGNLLRSYGKWPFIVDFPMNSMVMFHSYVKLPEGMVICLVNSGENWLVTQEVSTGAIHALSLQFLESQPFKAEAEKWIAPFDWGYVNGR